MDTTVPKSPDIPEPVQHVDRNEIGWAQQIYRFPNGYGASVVQVKPGDIERGSDLAVIRWNGDGPDDWHVRSKAVLGGDPDDAEYERLTVAEVHDKLAAIRALADPDMLTAEPPDPTCTGCGRPIHRVHGMWLDDLGRGHCASGAKQGHNSHTTAAARYELHATTVMTAIRDGRLVLSLAGPAGSVDVELHPSDLMELAEDLNARLTGGPAPAGVKAMPVFVLKGKDALAPGTIDAYRRECLRHGLVDQAEEVEKAFREMAAWQALHPEQTKLPDHKHVPVGPATTQGGAR